MGLINTTLVDAINKDIEKYKSEQKLPVRLEYLGNQAINPFVRHCTSSRLQMTGSYLSTHISVRGMTPRSCQTGMERQFAKGTMKVKSPLKRDIVVLRRVKRFAERDQINPEDIIIYREIGSNKIGMLSLPKFEPTDEPFGFRYTEPKVDISQGSVISKDTVIIDDTAITETGDYRYGLEIDCALMDIPGVNEDGIVVSEELLDDLAFTAYEKISINLDDKDDFLVPIYEGSDPWKFFPDIGEEIDESGLIACVRKKNVLLSPISQASLDRVGSVTRRPNPYTDRLTYGRPKARVVDIKILRGHQASNQLVNRQLDRYVKTQAKYIYTVLDTVYSVTRREKNISLTPELQRFMTNGLAYLHNADPMLIKNLNTKHRLGLKENKIKSGLNYSIRETVLSGYQIEITTAYEYKPNLGTKLTGCHGDKAVICGIWPKENMPVDEYGRRAKLITSSISTIGRSNVSRLFEHFLNGIKSDFIASQKDLIKAHTDDEIRAAFNTMSDEMVIKVSENVLEFMQLTNPEWAKCFINYLEDQKADINKLANYLADMLIDPLTNFTTYIRPDMAKPLSKACQDLQERYGLRMSPVTYISPNGKKWTTKKPVLIASMYYMVLNKLSDAGHAISSTRRQPNGIPGRLSVKDRKAYPGTLQATRIWDETTTRIGCTNMPYGAMAELSDRVNNPIAASAITDAIYATDKPGAIDNAVKRSDQDRGIGQAVPLGASRTQQLAIHPLQCAGIDLTTD